MELNDLKPELVEKARACTSAEEVLQLAQEEGHEISDDELEGVSGGDVWRDLGLTHKSGDAREDINPALIPDDFVNGLVDGGELD